MNGVTDLEIISKLFDENISKYVVMLIVNITKFFYFLADR